QYEKPNLCGVKNQKEKASVGSSEPEKTDSQRNAIPWKRWIAPLLGATLIATILIGKGSDFIEHPWVVGDILCDSSKRVTDSTQRLVVLEKGGTILKQQLAMHPYHARVWAMLGHYYIQKKDWDSCIYSEKRALTIGHGSLVNSIEKMSNQYLSFALGQKLNPIFHMKDSAMGIIQSAVVPGYENKLLDKFRGLVYVNCHEYPAAVQYLESYLKKFPNDYDALYAAIISYMNSGLLPQAREYLERAKKINPGAPNLQLLSQQIYKS
ncbi:MAG TPA: tetratricopeptide repeat protein, partial [Chitinophagaceae bacterium]|nr:tetratricopeptide repeat protein [Chitinophagaceae bacterium]